MLISLLTLIIAVIALTRVDNTAKMVELQIEIGEEEGKEPGIVVDSTDSGSDLNETMNQTEQLLPTDTTPTENNTNGAETQDTGTSQQTGESVSGQETTPPEDNTNGTETQDMGTGQPNGESVAGQGTGDVEANGAVTAPIPPETDGGGTDTTTVPETPQAQEETLQTLEETPTTAPEEDDTWGHWKFYDGDAENRPKGDYCEKHPNRDIKAEEFPENAWQTDAV